MDQRKDKKIEREHNEIYLILVHEKKIPNTA